MELKPHTIDIVHQALLDNLESGEHYEIETRSNSQRYSGNVAIKFNSCESGFYTTICYASIHDAEIRLWTGAWPIDDLPSPSFKINLVDPDSFDTIAKAIKIFKQPLLKSRITLPGASKSVKMVKTDGS